MKSLPYILFEKYTYVLASEMTSPGNRANCIGALSFPVARSFSVGVMHFRFPDDVIFSHNCPARAISLGAEGGPVCNHVP